VFVGSWRRESIKAGIMNGVEIMCGTCRRGWRLPLTASPYLLLELTSQPCPYCEAATLSWRDAGPHPEPGRGGRRALARPTGGPEIQIALGG
jgi:hypothetical protein